jgi:hypothetical protein
MAWQLCYFKGILVDFFVGGGGGRIEVAICDRAGELDRTAQSPTSTTQQSTSERGGGGWNGRGMAWRHCFLPGDFGRIFRRGGGVG